MFKIKKDKLGMVKKAIQEVAKDKHLFRNQYYKITNDEIWSKIVDLKYDKYVAYASIAKFRLQLPKGYFNKYF